MVIQSHRTQLSRCGMCGWLHIFRCWLNQCFSFEGEVNLFLECPWLFAKKDDHTGNQHFIYTCASSNFRASCWKGQRRVDIIAWQQPLSNLTFFVAFPRSFYLVNCVINSVSWKLQTCNRQKGGCSKQLSQARDAAALNLLFLISD